MVIGIGGGGGAEGRACVCVCARVRMSAIGLLASPWHGALAAHRTTLPPTP